MNIHELILVFLCGVGATLIFHQGCIYLFVKLQIIAVHPWDMTLIPSIKLPRVFFLSFLGGVLGLPAFYLGRTLQKMMPAIYYWIGLTLFGAIFFTLVEVFMLFPYYQVNTTPKMLVVGLIANGLWGIGHALCINFPLRNYQRRGKIF